MALSAHTPSYPPKAAEVSRSRSNQSNIVPAPRQGAGSASSTSSNLNKVLFTLPWSVQFGESLSVSGEGSELGSWNPEESLPLKWNEGDLWAAGTIRHYGCCRRMHASLHQVLIHLHSVSAEVSLPTG